MSTTRGRQAGHRYSKSFTRHDPERHFGTSLRIIHRRHSRDDRGLVYSSEIVASPGLNSLSNGRSKAIPEVSSYREFLTVTHLDNRKCTRSRIQRRSIFRILRERTRLIPLFCALTLNILTSYSYLIFFFSLFHLLHRCSNLKATKHIFLGRFVQSFRENTFCRSIGIASRGKLGFVAGQQYRVDSEQSHQTERVTSLLSIALVDHDLVRLVALLRYLIKSKCATCVGIFKDSPSK